MSRADQDEIVRWTLSAIEPDGALAPPPALPLDRFAQAGLATGLTALVGALIQLHDVPSPDGWAPLLRDQQREVAARHVRFSELLPRVLRSLSAGGVGAIPVKGAVIASSVWPIHGTRPMADIDLVVDPTDRDRARRCLGDAGFQAAESTAWEDTFLGWGDGAVGRLDGESAAHNGKVELHPGWVERIHNYLVGDGGAVTGMAEPSMLAGEPCLRLPPGAFAAHVLGHLSASVVRAEVRAVNLVDVVVLLPALDAGGRRLFGELIGRLDGRLTAPGLWLVDRYRPGLVDAEWVTAAAERLPRAATARLESAGASSVFRSFGTRTDARWRAAFATTFDERARMTRQLLWPSEARVAERIRSAIGRRSA